MFANSLLRCRLFRKAFSRHFEYVLFLDFLSQVAPQFCVVCQLALSVSKPKTDVIVRVMRLVLATVNGYAIPDPRKSGTRHDAHACSKLRLPAWPPSGYCVEWG